MNEKGKPSESTEETQEALALLCESLDLSQEAAFFFAVCDSEATQRQMMQQVRDHLRARGREVRELELSPARPNLVALIGDRAQPPSPPVIFVVMRGLEDAKMSSLFLPVDALLRRRVEDASLALRTLNLDREQLREKGYPLVFWLNRSTLEAVIQLAADVFAARSGIFFLYKLPLHTEARGIAALEVPDLRNSYLALPPEELERRANLYKNLLLQERMAKSPNLPGVAFLCQELAIIDSALGENERASEFLQQATDLFRELARRNPDDFLPSLALSLNNLGATLFARGLYYEAMTNTREAVEIARELAASNPQVYRPVLATSLSNLSRGLSALGQQEEALKATQEAVDIYRQLASARPEVFRPYLAASLNNLGRDLSALDRWEEALVVTLEAVKHYQELARGHPQTFLLDLATSLNNFSAILSKLGRQEEAQAAYREAARIFAFFFQSNPGFFNILTQMIP